MLFCAHGIMPGCSRPCRKEGQDRQVKAHSWIHSEPSGELSTEVCFSHVCLYRPHFSGVVAKPGSPSACRTGPSCPWMRGGWPGSREVWSREGTLWTSDLEDGKPSVVSGAPMGCRISCVCLRGCQSAGAYWYTGSGSKRVLTVPLAQRHGSGPSRLLEGSEAIGFPL